VDSAQVLVSLWEFTVLCNCARLTLFRLYMVDGLYQSVMVFFMIYFLFAPATFETESGLGVADTKRMGVYIASTDVVVVNIYMLMNTYRWDWFMLLIVAFSILLIWFWTGVYTAGTAGFQFYKAAPQVYGQLSFWAAMLVTAIICLMPRFVIKAVQKVYFPRDVDIIREQIRQGKFDYLKEAEPGHYLPPPPEKEDESSSSGSSKTAKPHAHNPSLEEDQRPIYPPSVAPTSTTTTHNMRSQNGSDSTNYSWHRPSHDLNSARPQSIAETPISPVLTQVRSSTDRPRPSFDRVRQSMDRIRPSFEASNDFTSAALLARMESRQSGELPVRGSGGRVSRLRHALSSASRKDKDH
jgi:phospholipid-translocating ATPase